MSCTKQGSKPKRKSKVAPFFGAAGLSLSLAGGASAATGAPVADGLTHNTIVSHQIMLGEEEITDVTLATFYVFDKENTEPSRRGVRQACGCWTGTYYTSANDAYPSPLRPIRRVPTPNRAWKSSQLAHQVQQPN